MIERAEKNITLQNIEKVANALNLKLSHFFKDFNMASPFDTFFNKV